MEAVSICSIRGVTFNSRSGACLNDNIRPAGQETVCLFSDLKVITAKENNITIHGFHNSTVRLKTRDYSKCSCLFI